MIKLKLELDPKNDTEMRAASEFFRILSGGAAAPEQITEASYTEGFIEPLSAIATRTDAEAKEKQKATRNRKKREAQKEEAPKEEEAQKEEAQKEEAQKEEGEIPEDDVRALIPLAANIDKVKVKEKLTSFGAHNFTTLEKKHHRDFYEFLQSVVEEAE